LTSVFSSNVAARASKADACAAIAAVLHAGAGLGAVVSGSVPPAPPAPIPVL
jgi:hypothetical protein